MFEKTDEHFSENSAKKLGITCNITAVTLSLFKSPRDVMQETTFGAQLGLGSELVAWYRDAMSVPFGHFSNNLWPRTDDRKEFIRFP